MIDPKELDKIALLSRLHIEEGEKEKLRKDIESIVAYISMLQNAPSAEVTITDTIIPKNVLRDDTDPHEAGLYTEAIVGQAPRRRESYVVVKKIL
jgi:aspartyl/glutamyl-tRNA(Asn/Gln) amidotransferase C subunit